MFASKQRGTVIASGLKIVGNVTAEGVVEVHSQIEGELHCTSLIIAPGACVTGMIAAKQNVCKLTPCGPYLRRILVSAPPKVSLLGTSAGQPMTSGT